MEYNLILTDEELDEMVSHYRDTENAWAFDVETTGADRLDPRVNNVTWISFACEDRTDVIPMGHLNGHLLETVFPLLKAGKIRQDKGLPHKPSDYSVDIKKAEYTWGKTPMEGLPPQLSRGDVFKALAPLFSSSSVKVAHNAKFDIGSVQKYLGVFPVGPFFDTKTYDWVTDSTRFGKLGLADCVERHLGIEMDKGVGVDISIHSFDDVAEYSALDARRTYDLYAAMKADQTTRDEYDSLWSVFQLEMRVLEVLARMESHGVKIDLSALEILHRDFESKASIAKSDVYHAAGRRFSINSVPEKQRILYGSKSSGGQGLRHTLLTPKGEKKKVDNEERARAGEPKEPMVISDYSTSAEALKDLAPNPVVEALSRFQRFSKLQSTYVTPYLGGVTKKAGKEVKVKSKLVRGRLHTTFVQDRAETGRLASRSINLQNVPSRSEEGAQIRKLFIPSEGCIFVASDYSQIEPRIIASFSGEKDMIKTYLDGGDLYQIVADQVGISRNAGKTLVLAIAYGTGASNIAGNIDISVSDAFHMIDEFNRRFPRIQRMKRQTVAVARRRTPRYTETILGRRRYLPHINSIYRDKQSRAERQAFNHRIQGSAADIMKLALIAVYKALPPTAKMLLTIHDEIIVETPQGTEEEISAIMKREMESVGEPYFKVPLVAEPVVAMNWAEAK